MKISKFFQAGAMCAGLLMLMGCPYSNSIPLSNAETKTPAFLLGTWELSGSDAGGDKIEVKKSTDYLMEIIKTTTGEYGSTDTYTGYVTTINNVLFLNLAEKSEYDSDYTYYFYKIEKQGDNKVVLYSVTPNIRETFDNQDALKAYFASNMQNSYFFETGEETYYKIK